VHEDMDDWAKWEERIERETKEKERISKTIKNTYNDKEYASALDSFFKGDVDAMSNVMHNKAMDKKS
jgi:uncharacterized protein (UPF0335 family)